MPGTIIVPAGCAFYVTNACDSWEALVEGHVVIHRDLLGATCCQLRGPGVFYSRHEVQYPSTAEVTPAWVPAFPMQHLRIFTLPPNPVGKFLVVLLDGDWPKPYEVEVTYNPVSSTSAPTKGISPAAP